MQTPTVPPTPTWRSAFADRSLATSFAHQAALYARLRPEYPAGALDAALPAGATRVLDLGAGTGKLTGSLLARGLKVLAVEPLEAMLAQLHRAFPAAAAVAGSAESVPLRGRAVDAVLVGQAFHWFDAARALPEMARVLRPGGTLSLLWNHDDDADPLVSAVKMALNRAGRPIGGSTGRAGTADRPAGGAKPEGAGPQPVPDNGPPPTSVPNGSEPREPAAPPVAEPALTKTAFTKPLPPFADDPAFTEPALTEIRWTRQQSVEDFLELQHTYSYVIRATDQVRAQLDSEVRAILRQFQPDNRVVRVPVICQVWSSRCR